MELTNKKTTYCYHSRKWVLALCLCLFWVTPLYADPVLVVNPSINQQTIKLNTLRAIFAMRLTKWPNGRLIRVFVLADDSKAHNTFCKSVLKVLPHQLRRAWDRNVFSGTGEAPFEVKNMREMREFITNTQGAIGYLPENSISQPLKLLPVE